jgi:hypothetical protein
MSLNKQRFAPIFHALPSKFGEIPPGRRAVSVASAEDIKPLFYPHDGIMPFWQLAYK